MTNTAVINFRANPQLKLRIENLAKQTKRPASFYYNYLLDEYLDELILLPLLLTGKQTE